MVDLFAPPTEVEVKGRHIARSQKRQALYDTLNLGDRVRVKDSRKRMSGKIIRKDITFDEYKDCVSSSVTVRFGPRRGIGRYSPEEVVKV